MSHTPAALLIEKPPAIHPLFQRLTDVCGAHWVHEASLATWLADDGGARALLLAGDPIQFPEGLDLAVVLPELRQQLIRLGGETITLGLAEKASENALAKHFGSIQWPSLIVTRDGAYLGTIAGMWDWDVFVTKLQAVLAAEPTRRPGIGIAVVAGDAANRGGNACAQH